MSKVMQNALPGSWKLTTLGEVIRPSRPKVQPKDHTNLPFIGMGNIETQTTKLLGTVPSFTMKSSAVHFQPGDVLYGRLRPYLNKVYKPDFEGLCSAEFIVFPEVDHLNNKYLMYLLNSPEFVSFATHLNTGDRPRIDFGQMESYQFPLPPLHVQKNIVLEIEKQFTRLEAGESALKRMQANLKRYRASVLKTACEGRLVLTEAELARKEGRSFEHAEVLLRRILEERSKRVARTSYRGKTRLKDTSTDPLPSDTIIPKLPEGWTYATVEQLGIIGEQVVLTGPFGTNLGRKDFINSGVPLLTIACLRDKGINLDKAEFVSEDKANELERYRLSTGDLLFSRMASVGRAGIVGESLSGVIFNYHIMRLRLEPSVLNAKYYLAYVRGSEQVERYIRDVNHGATRDGINTAQLLKMPVSLPPFAEQHRIIAEIERRLSVIDKLETAVAANLKRTERLRQAILHKAFTGQLV